MTPAITRSIHHEYTFENRTYPGVTDILKAYGDGSEALMTWVAGQVAEAALAAPRDLWDQLDTVVGRKASVKALTEARFTKRDAAAATGTDIHALADKITQGMDTGWVDPSVLGRVEAYREWWANSGWTLRLSEALVVFPTMQYGGTFDLLAYDADGKTVLADIKTGNLYRKAILQLAAYGMAPIVARMDDPVAYPMPTPDRYVILHVTEGKPVREVPVTVTGAEQLAWSACVDLHYWTKATKGRL